MENKRLTDDELKAIRERVAKATPGPWRVDEHVEEIENGRGEWILRGDYVEDVQFCASARADIPALLAHIEALAAENAALWAELDNKRIAFKQLVALHNDDMGEFMRLTRIASSAGLPPIVDAREHG